MIISKRSPEGLVQGILHPAIYIYIHIKNQFVRAQGEWGRISNQYPDSINLGHRETLNRFVA